MIAVDDDLDIIDSEHRIEPVNVQLPHLYTARPYQADLFRAKFEEKKRRFAVVWHRRAGKDKTYWQIAVAATQERVGSYWYMLPKSTQARKAIWKGRGKDGLRFLDHIPREIIASVNNTEMYIEFTNGSMLYVLGSDSYNHLVGNNPLGVVYSEWSLCDPASWDYIRPILAENGGWAMFCYTPRGRNHGYTLLENAKKFPDRWYVSVLTAEETRDNDGNPIITPEIIQEERDEGMTEDMIQQEYYCSFDAAIPGAYFGKEVRAAYEDGRVCRVPIEKSLPVYTFWDLGISDDMAIWLMQPYGKELRLIACYSNSGEGMDHYINWLHEFSDKHGIRYAEHYAPHDIEVRELMSGESRRDTAKKMGIDFKTVPRVAQKSDSINALRTIFPRLAFDSVRCEHGLNAIASYHREYDDKRKTFKAKPEHDWSSNLSDALQQLAMAWKDKLPKKPKSQPRPVPGGWMGA
ncbi:hypothetical protein [uncultured Alcanivorax sp.]|uniref:hypothetical protein n=1 Tax=uncultured Alcanivorax sp. TaxID=191215 RepID=UPI001187C885|nr:MAG: hypothetical protein Tp1122MES720101_13 [Prokaryotic dsDNA virus sp.]|tara:strand:- start:15389 stop:16777 length:1389 start_codon:yes stop_codon:yes gene_type:complete